MDTPERRRKGRDNQKYMEWNAEKEKCIEREKIITST